MRQRIRRHTHAHMHLFEFALGLQMNGRFRRRCGVPLAFPRRLQAAEFTFHSLQHFFIRHTESISRGIASAERRSGPLNTMCSMKCASPFSSCISRREPLRTHPPTETERTCVIVSVMTTRPLGSTCLRISRASVVIPEL